VPGWPTDIVFNRAGLWNNDAAHSLVVLDTPAGFGSAVGYGVSEDARVAGVANGLDGLQHAVLWQNDAAHTAFDLGTLPGDLKSGAYGVNDAGQVVGVSLDSSSIGRGFIYQNGTMKELTALLDTADSGWTINETAGINNAGDRDRDGG
jgi:probable HAF family extracellular repeat protein